MVEGFVDLKIDGSYIRELILVPSQRVRMSLLRGPQSKNERQVALEYNLQFDKLQGFRINLQAKPWLETKSHNLLLDSDYLISHASVEGTEKTKAISGRGEHKVYHFQINCNEGNIDIIAENFTVSFIDEIPYFGSFHGMESQRANSGIQFSAETRQEPKLKCAFCGREQFEVSKIIAGLTANICSECVETCSELIAEQSE